MQSTQKLFQVFVQRDQQRRPSRWFSRESLAKRYCDEFNVQSKQRSPSDAAETSSSSSLPSAQGTAIAVYQLVEIPVVRPKVMTTAPKLHFPKGNNSAGTAR
jgi:hypothetical protein